MSEVCADQITKSTTILCPHCGKEVQANVAFCPHCGTALREDSAIKKSKKRANLSAMAGIAIFIGAIGTCLVALGGGAWWAFRFLFEHPIVALAVLLLWIVGQFLRFRRSRRNTR